MTEQGIIIKALSGFYYVKTEHGILQCRARGKFRHEKETPLVGDFVSVESNTVVGIRERKNQFIRPAVANIDLLVMLAANVNPVTDPFLIDRVAAIAGDQEVPLLLVLNKCDLDPADDLYRIYTHAGIPVLRTSAATGDGIDVLRDQIHGKTCAFTGNSGVGKSSVLNALAPDLQLKTDAVSDKLGRGRHTTRHIELFAIGDAQIADTPGFSSFETDRMELVLKENLQFAFSDFGPYIGKCKYPDCAHMEEPGCAVRTAVDSGAIEPTRYSSYQKLYDKMKEIKLWEINQSN